MKTNKKIFAFAVFTRFLFPITKTHAVVQRLNGLSGSNQTFSNDTNVGISSSGTTHTINWSGILSESRGGTGYSSFATAMSNWSGVLGFSKGGTGAVSFTSGSIPFVSGTNFSEDNTNLFWDSSNQRLNVKEISISDDGIITSRHGDGLKLTTETATSTGNTDAQITFITGNSSVSGDGGDILFSVGNGLAGGSPGRFVFDPKNGSADVVLDFNSVTGNLPNTHKIFSFPNVAGTITILQANQTFSGLNKFEATTTNSTIYVGSSTKSGCIAMGDSDNSGITYITANDGVLEATTTKPSICQ